MGFFTLFLSSFASATLLPGGSEALLLYLLNEHFNPYALLASATLGNTLGSFLNYFLGKYATNFCLRKGYMKEKHLSKATLLFEKYGAWSLLFAWLPLIGDPLTFVAGIVRYVWWKFLMIVCFAKLSRYVFMYLGFLALTQ
ncbi:YqaA family protein [Sulfurospirillum barnesii]|uniref:Putative membrane protein n=1 Tax=Sulfurospirillum barnesii (strain ATCC 700032 / DSM 10660 / SES-3) TaxID=760154 RepID=I3Y042_SULBS|nr:YqaA family protein [Sulfurospirillum barnesii]AFL69566.1 putative membrane protein [Sulfurospirillum barnesii SES-3]